MRELKKYALRNDMPGSYKLTKPTRAVLELLKTGAKSNREICAALPSYKPSTIGGAIHELRKEGLLDTPMSGLPSEKLAEGES
jgi:hypothetical protein